MNLFIELPIRIYDQAAMNGYNEEIRRAVEASENTSQPIEDILADIEPPLHSHSLMTTKIDNITGFTKAFSLSARFDSPDQPAMDITMVSFEDGSEVMVDMLYEDFGEFFKQCTNAVIKKVPKNK